MILIWRYAAMLATATAAQLSNEIDFLDSRHNDEIDEIWSELEQNAPIADMSFLEKPYDYETTKTGIDDLMRLSEFHHSHFEAFGKLTGAQNDGEIVDVRDV